MLGNYCVVYRYCLVWLRDSGIASMVSLAALCAALSLLYKPLVDHQARYGFAPGKLHTSYTTYDTNRTEPVVVAIQHGSPIGPLTYGDKRERSPERRAEAARAPHRSYGDGVDAGAPRPRV